jgi:hypothetical protein
LRGEKSGGGRNNNNMTCYPKGTQKHRSLPKMSKISEHNFKLALKRSNRKGENWPAFQILLNPTGLGDH